MEYGSLIVMVIKIGVLVVIGMIVANKVPLTKDIRHTLVFIIINIALPAMIINGFLQIGGNTELIHQMVILFFISVGVNFVGLGVGCGIAKLFQIDRKRSREIGFLAIFGNTGLIGIPLCASLFGAKGAVFASIFDAGMGVTLWTAGVWMLQRKKLTWKMGRSLFTAPLLAIFVGVIFVIFPFPPGFFLLELASTLSGAASPLAMIYIGMVIMTTIKGKKLLLAFKLLALPSSMKLFFFPLIGLICLLVAPISLTSEVKQVILIQMAMPTITTASIIMAQNNSDEEFGILVTLITTIVSLVSIPVIMYIGGVLQM